LQAVASFIKEGSTGTKVGNY